MKTMSKPDNTTDSLERKNKRMLAIVLSVVGGMIFLSFASVPLYDLFCRVTGYGGTTQVSEDLPDQIVTDRVVTIRFNTDTAPGLPWTFRPEMRQVRVNPGQQGLINYRAENTAEYPIIGTAVYNVTPPKAGRYFHKVQCFCFEEQTLQPGESMHMPVMFYVDPAMADDPNMRDVRTITLSYTFFKAHTQELEQALEDFYNQDQPAAGHL